MISSDYTISKQEVHDLLNKIDCVIKPTDICNDSLTAGSLGLVIYYFNRYSGYHSYKDKFKFISLLEGIFARINEGKSSLFSGSFARGMCGFATVLHYISENSNNEVFFSDNEITQIDSYLYNQAINMIHNNENDFLYGSLGIVNYFLKRVNEPKIRHYIQELTDMLLTSTINSANGLFIQNSFFEKTNINQINFSLSHGHASFLIILIKIINAGIREEECKRTLNSGIAFLLNHKQNNHSKILNYIHFPISVTKEKFNPTFSSRLGWCYGDLNQVLVLYKAASLLKTDIYNKIADEVGLNTTFRRSFKDTLCNSSQFCHGSAGLSEFYKTLYAIRPLECYLKSQYHWTNQTISFLKTELKTSALPFTYPYLLEGLIGTALSLFSFISEKKSKWQFLFLLD